MKPSTTAALALIASAVWAIPATADWTEARCDIYPKGSDKLEKMVPCTFAQSQGHIAITRKDGVTHDLMPVGDKEYGNCPAGILRMEGVHRRPEPARQAVHAQLHEGLRQGHRRRGRGKARRRHLDRHPRQREIRLWGFVDQGNLYGDAGAKRLLGEWWSGQGPNANTWRFDLKAEAGDPVGRSFAVLVPNDAGREDLLERLVADARARRATKVFVTGRLFRFHAPTQTRDLTGLYLQMHSSQDIRFDPLGGD